MIPAAARPPKEANRWLRPKRSAIALCSTSPIVIAVTPRPRTPPVAPCKTLAAKTDEKLGDNARIKAAKATTLLAAPTNARLDWTRSRSSPAGSWVSRPATPPAVRTKPMLAGSQPRSARWIATNGPKPACSPARKKLSRSSARRLLEGGRAKGAVRTFATARLLDELFEGKVPHPLCTPIDSILYISSRGRGWLKGPTAPHLRSACRQKTHQAVTQEQVLLTTTLLDVTRSEV